MRVLLFGRLGDLAGWRERIIDPHLERLSDLRAYLAAEDAQLGEALAAKGVQTAVNLALVRGDAVLPPACEVAFLPAMSGG